MTAHAITAMPGPKANVEILRQSPRLFTFPSGSGDVNALYMFDRYCCKSTMKYIFLVRKNMVI